ncbi:DUF7281 domain-containing protein [Ferrimonas lipolytica]|uniref:DUF7281 domain-containing protein n=1 Tax=Ferrimonas lipolytica TaxID=2724191 RepID=A0A6H1UF10_9GAMM|nr:hypothetical protein [Ferrimonas lipolytica]QIZ76382.1 hypothetical protein HER31_05625 [Ferrimonas lipolytica]
MAAVGQVTTLTRSMVKQVDKLRRDPSGRAKLNVNLNKLHLQFEFGSTVLEHGYLRYTPEQLAQLEREITALGGFADSREVAQRCGDRHQMAGISSQEKLAAHTPSHDKIYYRPGADDLVHWGLANDRVDMSLRIAWQQLPPLTSVLLVENLDSFDCIRQYPLTDELAKLPVIYRGHGIDAKAVKALLAARPQLKVIWFGDWDPKGLLLAVEFGAGAIVLPASFDKLKGDPHKWLQQDRQQQQLEQVANHAIKPIWQQLKPHKTCWMQQQVLAQKVPLVVVPLTPAALKR